MKCSKCGSTNVQVVPDVHGNMHDGSLGQTLARILLIICTCGLWALFVRKGRGKVRTTMRAICLNCGHQGRI